MSDGEEELTPLQQEAQNELEAAMVKWGEANNILVDGFFLGDWVLIGATNHPLRPRVTRYFRGYSGGHQAPHITAGLLQYARVINDDEITDFDYYGDDDIDP